MPTPIDVVRAADAGPVLRRAARRDIPEIMAMMTDFHSEDRIPWHPREAQRAISELFANDAYGVFWLIEVDWQSIGFLVLTFGFSLEFHGRTAFVDEFYVRPEFRGQGIGTKALHHIGTKALHQMMAYCVRQAIRTVHLEVEQSNPRVHRLYERAGFEDRGFYILSKWIRISPQDENLRISEQGERG
jgi:GNAT superfamily N-acetyltransferase